MFIFILWSLPQNLSGIWTVDTGLHINMTLSCNKIYVAQIDKPRDAIWGFSCLECQWYKYRHAAFIQKHILMYRTVVIADLMLECWCNVFIYINFDYNFTGVPYWPYTFYEQCGGIHQSPINIDTSMLMYDIPHCSCLGVYIDDSAVLGELKNTGNYQQSILL